jgi:hypothetical protein
MRQYATAERRLKGRVAVICRTRKQQTGSQIRNFERHLHLRLQWKRGKIILPAYKCMNLSLKAVFWTHLCHVIHKWMVERRRYICQVKAPAEHAIYEGT